MKTSGEFLIFLLLLITNARVFFVESRKDAVVVLSPLAFFLSIFQIFSWGFDVFTGLAFFLSILVLFSNFHALYRYFEHLYVDHYSPLMYVWAIFTTLLCLLSIVFLICFMPSVPFTQGKVKHDFEKLSFYSERYSGNFRSGFEKAGLFQKTNMRLNYFESQTDNPVILFFPDKRAETYHYIPYLTEIAKKGFSIVSSDFNAKDVRWLHNFCDARVLRRFGMVVSSLTDEYRFNSQKEFYTFNSLLECNAVFEELNKNEKYKDRKYIIISDFMADIAASDFKKSHPDQILDVICLDRLSEYKTPGYGFVAQTDPLLIRFLGQERDKSGSESRLVAEKTVTLLEEIAAREKQLSDSEKIEVENDAE